MFLSLLALLVLPFSTQTPAPAAAPAIAQTAAVTAESLIPANALVVLRIRSVDGLEKSVQAIVPGLPVGQQLLGGLMMAAEAPLPIDQIDRTAPLIVAACPGAAQPEPMFILTCKDPAAFTAPLNNAGWTCTTHGNLVACSKSKPGPALAADAPMRMGLDRNDVVLRIAMEQVMGTYGELLHAGIGQQLEELDTEMEGTPGGENITSSLSRLDEALDEIEILEINLSQQGNQTRLGLEMTALAGSDLADVPKADASTLPMAARAIGEDAAVSMLAVMDFAKLTEMFQGVMDSALKELPEDERQSFDGMMRMSMELYAQMGSTISGSYDFDEQGMHGSTWMQPKDPAAYMTKLVELFKTSLPWMPVTGPEKAAVDGTEVSTYRFKFDLDKMPGASKSLQTMGAEEKAKFDKVMAAMFGPDGMKLSMAPVSGGLVAAIGDVAELKTTMARVAAKAPTPLGAELLRELGNMNPGFVMRMDLGRYMAGFGALAAAMPGAEQANLEQAMTMFRSFPPMQFAGGVDGRVWKLSLSTDVAKLVASANSLASGARKPKNSTAMSPEREQALFDIALISSALDAYALGNTGDYPDSLDALVKPDENGERYYPGDKLPMDPWGRAYVYTKPGEGHPQPRVASLGADGKAGGTGADADIDNASEDEDDR